MLKILNIEKNNNIYKIDVYIEIDFCIKNKLGITSYFKQMFYNEDLNELTIDKNKITLNNVETIEKNEEKVKTIVENNRGLIKKTIAGVMLGLSLNGTPTIANDTFVYNQESIQKYNITMQKNITENYAPIIENLKNKVVDEFLVRYGDKMPSNITKKQILDNFIVQLSDHINTANTYSINLENVENKDRYLEVAPAVQALSKNVLVGNMDKVNVINNNGYISVNLSLDLLNKLNNNSNDKEYVNSFNAMMSNLSIHELTHKYLHYNEVGAVDSQIHPILSEKFKKDVIESSLIKNEENLGVNDYQKYFKSFINYNGMNSLFSNISEEDDLTYSKAYENVKNKILDTNEINKYLMNNESNQNHTLYLVGDRNVDEQKYVSLHEYANAVLGDKIFSTENLGFFEKNKVDSLYKETLDINVDYAGGLFFNAMVNLADSNANEKEVEIFNKLLTKHLFEMKMSIPYMDNIENHKIIFESIYEKINDMYDKAKEHSLKFSPELHLESNQNSMKNI